jgi:FkbM family methyltransferase
MSNDVSPADLAELQRQALAQDGRDPARWLEHGALLANLGRVDPAIEAFARAAALAPGLARAHANLAEALRRRDRLVEAEASGRRAVALDPLDPVAHYNLGVVLGDLGRRGEAIVPLRAALALKADMGEAHFELAEALLGLGRLREGWDAYEWRFRFGAGREVVPRIARPQWAGEPLAGRTILVYGEQGFGDTIQFARFAPLLARGGARVILACAPELAPLLSSLAGIAEIHTDWSKIGAFDFHGPLASLPRGCATSLATIPREMPYLSVAPERLARWQARIAAVARPSTFKVGLVWAGRPTHGNDRNRSLPLAALAPLLDTRGVSFFSLQKGAGEDEAATLAAAGRLIALGGEIKDFADSAAAASALDLVIAVDTAIVHLCGALGRPAWALLAHAADWRWLEGREDSPWYPSVRLFRQPAFGQWEKLIARAASELAAAAGDRARLAATPSAAAPAADDERPGVARACRHGALIWPRGDTYVGRSLAVYGEYGELEMAQLAQLLRRGDVVVEAGANIGALTLPIARAVGPHGRVHAFEPQAPLFQMLCANLALNGVMNVDAQPIAVGAKPGRVAMPALDYGAAFNFGGVALDPAAPGDVAMIAVDQLKLAQLRLLKADVEGMEADVVTGARETIKRLRPILYLENDRADKSPGLIQLVQSLGYRLWWHVPPLFNPDNHARRPDDVFGRIVSVNVLCLPRESDLKMHGFREITKPDDRWDA